MAAARSSFSLKTLMLLMTGIAVLAAMVGHAWRQPIVIQHNWATPPGSPSSRAATLAFTVGSLFILGSLLGTCLGLRFHRRLLGAFIGFLTGLLTAGLAAALVTADPSVSVACGGCSAVVLASLVLRRS